MRKFLLALIAISMAVALVGCGSSDSTTESATSEVASKTGNTNNSVPAESSSAVSENIKAIKFIDASDVTFSRDWQDVIRNFSVEPPENSAKPEETLEFVSENTEIATIEYKQDDQCKMTPVSAGETYVYIQTTDHSIKSDKIKITVPQKEYQETAASANSAPVDDSKNTAAENKAIVDDSQNIVDEDKASDDESRTVYTTPYGKKYHYDKSCAGENATPTTEESAKQTYQPCKKCAQ